MNNAVTATYAKNNLGLIIDQVISSRKKVLIKRAGRPAVYITPVSGNYELDFTEEDFKKLEVGTKKFRSSFKFSF